VFAREEKFLLPPPQKKVESRIKISAEVTLFLRKGARYGTHKRPFMTNDKYTQ
jgi:hypothetical protein